jgi:hypothetical protein
MAEMAAASAAASIGVELAKNPEALKTVAKVGGGLAIGFVLLQIFWVLLASGVVFSSTFGPIWSSSRSSGRKICCGSS